MQSRSPRTLLAMSAALALTVAALVPASAFAKGPGPGAGNGSCDADCPNDQPQAQQQVRARDGSNQGAQARTRASAGGGQQVQAGKGSGPAKAGQTQRRATGMAAGARNQAGTRAVGRGSAEDRPRGPEACEECQFEVGTLTDEQIADLVYMANEEKLAHDVYLALADLYELPIFARIAASEGQHQAAVNTILARHEAANPLDGLTAGLFSDTEIGAMYTSLVAQGSKSLEDALAAGVIIEEDDILELQRVMADLGETAAPDAYNMYSHLLAGSERHLAAFERNA